MGKKVKAAKTRYKVQCMNDAGDYETVKEFKHLSHAINFAQQQKKAGEKAKVVIIDVGAEYGGDEDLRRRGRMRKEVEELILAIDEAVVSKNPTYGDVVIALHHLAGKYRRDVCRVSDEMPYKDIRAAREKQLKYPYSVISMLD